jgi:hypothetical protein
MAYIKHRGTVLYTGGKIPTEPPEDPWYKGFWGRVFIGVLVTVVGGLILYWLVQAQ